MSVWWWLRLQFSTCLWTHDLMSRIFIFGQSWIPLNRVHELWIYGIRNSKLIFSNFLTQNANPRADVRTSHITSLCAPYKRSKIRWLHTSFLVFFWEPSNGRSKRPFPSTTAKKLPFAHPSNDIDSCSKVQYSRTKFLHIPHIHIYTMMKLFSFLLLLVGASAFGM